MHEYLRTHSELLLILAGSLFLISAAVLASGGGFQIWFAAKIVYAIGVIGLLLHV